VASNTKSAIVPSVPPSNAVSIDRTVNGASSPVDLASAISSAMADMRGVLINMTPDDVTTPIVPKSVLRLGFVFARTVAPMAQQLDHQAAMLLVARARKKAQAERLAAIEELEFWFRKEIAQFREEMAQDRRELRQARAELDRWKRIKDAYDVERDEGARLQ
jgi:hypothetical protein